MFMLLVLEQSIIVASLSPPPYKKLLASMGRADVVGRGRGSRWGHVSSVFQWSGEGSALVTLTVRWPND